MTRELTKGAILLYLKANGRRPRPDIIAQIVAKTGASRSTVKLALDDLASRGSVKSLGKIPTPRHCCGGQKAPVWFELSSPIVESKSGC